MRTSLFLEETGKNKTSKRRSVDTDKGTDFGLTATNDAGRYINEKIVMTLTVALSSTVSWVRASIWLFNLSEADWFLKSNKFAS